MAASTPPSQQGAVCTGEYSPVCCDGRSYGNACSARAAGAANCNPGPCCANREPVCCNGRDYANSCEATALGCQEFTNGRCAPVRWEDVQEKLARAAEPPSPRPATGAGSSTPNSVGGGAPSSATPSAGGGGSGSGGGGGGGGGNSAEAHKRSPGQYIRDLVRGLVPSSGDSGGERPSPRAFLRGLFGRFSPSAPTDGTGAPAPAPANPGAAVQEWVRGFLSRVRGRGRQEADAFFTDMPPYRSAYRADSFLPPADGGDYRLLGKVDDCARVPRERWSPPEKNGCGCGSAGDDPAFPQVGFALVVMVVALLMLAALSK